MSSDTTPSFRRLEPDARKSEILACAIRLFGEKPFSLVSTAEVAEAAGVARGLIHHYFGTKRDLYLEVVRTMMFVPPLEEGDLPSGTVHERAAATIEWLLNAVEAHGRTWVAVAGADGVGPDPEIQALLDEADDLAAERVLAVMRVDAATRQRPEARAVVRAFGGMVKAAVREWISGGTITRRQTHVLLTDMLAMLVGSSLPKVSALPAPTMSTR